MVIAGRSSGRSLGGFITDNFCWHWCFLINVPVGLLSLFAGAVRCVDEPRGLEQRAQEAQAGGLKFDVVGFVSDRRCSSAPWRSPLTAASRTTGSPARIITHRGDLGGLR